MVKRDPSLTGVFKVMRRLDLERETTAWNYMRRYAVDVIDTQKKRGSSLELSILGPIREVNSLKI